LRPAGQSSSSDSRAGELNLRVSPRPAKTAGEILSAARASPPDRLQAHDLPEELPMRGPEGSGGERSSRQTAGAAAIQPPSGQSPWQRPTWKGGSAQNALQPPAPITSPVPKTITNPFVPGGLR
jgi:hypothetical protein